MSEVKMRYFSPKKGHAVTRYGTDSTIGATRTPNGYEINESAVVAIPDSEVRRYFKEYKSHLDSGSLTERKVEDYEAWQAARRKTRSEDQAKREEEARKRKDQAANDEKDSSDQGS